jgi:P-type Cu+ transporter
MPSPSANAPVLESCFEEASMKVTDPVCKMTIDSEKAAGKSEYKGQTIYFCSAGCKAKFDQDPERYAGK